MQNFNVIIFISFGLISELENIKQDDLGDEATKKDLKTLVNSIFDSLEEVIQLQTARTDQEDSETMYTEGSAMEKGYRCIRCNNWIGLCRVCGSGGWHVNCSDGSGLCRTCCGNAYRK